MSLYVADICIVLSIYKQHILVYQRLDCQFKRSTSIMLHLFASQNKTFDDIVTNKKLLDEQFLICQNVVKRLQLLLLNLSLNGFYIFYLLFPISFPLSVFIFCFDILFCNDPLICKIYMCIYVL